MDYNHTRLALDIVQENVLQKERAVSKPASSEPNVRDVHLTR
jgi:hypothetical protein